MRIVECVPNISEGRDRAVIDAVVAAAEAVEGVTVLDVDPGADTNRTVITLVGEPDAVAEGAFRLVEAAKERIDMREHTGAHPRMGAVDVVPFVPISGVDMDDCVELANRVGRRIGEELGVPVYLYEHAATRPERRSLATSRAGEYEGLEKKLRTEEGAPDHGPADFVPSFGAVHVGARKILVAYNVDLNVTDKRWANRVAFDVREAGRTVTRGGEKVKEPGMLKGVRGLGWYIPEYGRAQVSMNLVDIDETPIHDAFDACETSARERGMRVTGSEIVGLVPREALLAAGRHYLRRAERSTGVPEGDVVHAARLSLGLDEVAEFDPSERVIEYRLAAPRPLASMTVTEFADETSRDSTAPGGGSVAAVAASLAASLTAMVANLPHPKSRFADVRDEIEGIAVEAQRIKAAMLEAIDDDTWAFEALMEASRDGDGAAVRGATLEAARVPLRVAEACPRIVELARRAGELGLEGSVSDAGVAAAMARAAVVGAAMNVRINLQENEAEADAAELLERAGRAVRETEAAAAETVEWTWGRIGALPGGDG